MAVKIGSFNMFKFSQFRSDKDIHKDLNKIGTYFVSYDSKFIDATSLAVLINSLAPKQKTSKGSPNENNSQDVMRNNLANEVEDELLKDLVILNKGGIQNTDESGDSAIGQNLQEGGLIRLNKEINAKNQNGDWVIEGSVILGSVNADKFCSVEGMVGKYHVRSINLLHDNQSVNKVSEGQTAEFRLKIIC